MLSGLEKLRSFKLWPKDEKYLALLKKLNRPLPSGLALVLIWGSCAEKDFAQRSRAFWQEIALWKDGPSLRVLISGGDFTAEDTTFWQEGSVAVSQEKYQMG